MGESQAHDHTHGGHDIEHGHLHDHGDPDHRALFNTWSCQPTHVFGPEALRAWLLNVPAGVLRLKGILRTGLQNNNSAWSELQCAGRQGSLHNASTPDAGAALVSISLRGHLPADALSALFDAPD